LKALKNKSFFFIRAQAERQDVFNQQYPNPDKPVEAKRKSRFIGELKIED